MSSPKPSPQPAPQQRFQSFERPKAIEGERPTSGAGGGTSPPAASLVSSKIAADSSPVEAWNNAIKAWARLALVVPFMALVVVLLGSDRFDEATFADVKLKGAGVRELVTITTMLLIVKLIRDASRLLTISRFTDLELDVSEKPNLESYISNDYVRPIDLLKVISPPCHEGLLALLHSLAACSEIGGPSPRSPPCPISKAAAFRPT